MSVGRYIYPLVSLALLAVYLGLFGLIDQESGTSSLQVVLGEPSEKGTPVMVYADRDSILKLDGSPVASAKLVPNPQSSGLHTAAWSISYMGKPEHLVAHSFVTGPYINGGWVNNGARISIAQQLLDDGDDEKEGDLATALIPAVKRMLSDSDKLRHYAGQVEKVALRIRVGPKAVAIGLGASFLDEANRPSQLTAAIGLRVRVRRGILQIQQIGEMSPRLIGAARQKAHAEGSTRGGGLGFFGGLLAAGVIGLSGGAALAVVGGSAVLGAGAGKGEADNQFERELSNKAKEVVEQLLPEMRRALSRFLSSGMRIDLMHPALSIRWRPAQLILEDNKAIHLLFDIDIRSERHRKFKSGLRPAMIGRNLRGSSRMSSNLRVDLSANLMNVLIFELWESGALNSAVNDWIQKFQYSTKDMRELLAFSVTKAAIHLPPSVSLGQEGRLRLAAGRIGLSLNMLEQDNRIPDSLFLHGSLQLESIMNKESQTLRISVSPAPLLASCGVGTYRDPLKPCLTDFVGVANRLLSGNGTLNWQMSWNDLQRRLSRMKLGANISIKLTPESINFLPGTRPMVRADASLFIKP